MFNELVQFLILLYMVTAVKSFKWLVFLELLQFASGPHKTGAFLQAGCPSYCPPNVRVLKATQSTIFVNLVKAPTSCHSFLVHQLTPEGKIATPSIYCWQYSICGYLRMWIPKCAIGVNMTSNGVAADADLSAFPRPQDILESSSLGTVRHQEDFKFLIQATIEHLSRQTATSMLCSWT